MKECNKNILCVLELSRKLLVCADRGDLYRKDDSCGVLFGVVRDCAYKMTDLARKERQRHIDNGLWDGDPPEHTG
jgi:hypothetical protein